MKIFLNYMESIRCKMLVKTELEKMNLHYKTVEPGEVILVEDITTAQRNQLNTALKKSGIELMNDKKAMLIERIKKIVVEMVHYAEERPLTKFSAFLSQKLNHNYTYLANLFSKVQGITIEQFIINHKIERVKVLLVYHQLTLTEIAYKMHYSSVSHLSNQFKRITGLTPSYFKQMENKRFNQFENF